MVPWLEHWAWLDLSLWHPTLGDGDGCDGCDGERDGKTGFSDFPVTSHLVVHPTARKWLITGVIDGISK